MITKLGKWADRLTTEEVVFSREAANALMTADWGNEFCSSDSIKTILNELKSPENISDDSILRAKALLFEIRFAYSILQSGLSAKYEYKAGVEDSSIDFIVYGKENDRDWLIELTSLRESQKVKDSTITNGNFSTYISPSNDDEMDDIIRAQRAILSKVANQNSNKPTKFPPLDNSTSRAIVIDMRSMNAGGGADKMDICNIVYGSRRLVGKGIDYEVYSKQWKRQDGSYEYVRGVFETDHPDERAKFLQERIHALVFISEKKYETGHINSIIKVAYNPKLRSEDVGFNFPITRA